ncbi:MAG TPA: histidine phosphatase family protein [Candidatus Binatia bacterium]|nr:histidine phosphatase family protein [Candidatus Binatia bacterium]
MNLETRTAAIAAVALLFLGAAPAPKKVKPAVPNAAAATIPLGVDSSLVADLQHGGYVMFLRHCMTNWNEKDGAEGNFADRSQQRNLSEAGQREAAAIGQSLKVLEIPIERVLASPMWRCRDTAQFAFGDYDTTGLLYWKGAKYREARIKMLSTAPAPGKNLVLIGHQDQLIPIVPGLKRDQLQEGDALIFKPLGEGKYRVVRQVTPFDWARIAGVEPPMPLTLPPQASKPLAADSTAAAKPAKETLEH